MSRQDEIAARIERAIVNGELRAGERLPTVRQLSSEHGVSGATVAAAYRALQNRGLVRGEVGRGTFVADGRPSPAFRSIGRFAPGSMPRFDGASRGNWRRRAVSTTASRLRILFPDALDCTSGKPDPHLLPLEPLRRAWTKALAETTDVDLQYASPEPVESLEATLRRRWISDGIEVGRNRMVIGSSAQQMILLSLSVVSLLNGTSVPCVLVEEPGFQTVFDAMERHGARLAGLELDELGVIPESLHTAIAASRTDAVLFTPRGQNPTGRSWSPDRRAAIADVLANHPQVVIIEDDQFAELALSPAASLINDDRLQERVIYIHSFAKTIAPDLRLAASLAPPRLSAMLAEAKSYTDGWNSRLAQRALASALDDPEVDELLRTARSTYAQRRNTLLSVLQRHLSALGVRSECQDGLNVWISLPQGFDASEVVERAAESGVLVVSGESFFLQPGNDSWIRMSISQLTEQDAEIAAHRFADSILNGMPISSTSIPL